MTVDRSVGAVSAALRSGADRFVVRIPVGTRGEVELVRNGVRVPINDMHNPLQDEGTWPRSVRLEASAFDRRITVALDGKLLFEPYDYDRPRRGPFAGEIPIGLGVNGSEMTIHRLRIFRDVHYTATLAGMPLASASRSASSINRPE